MSAVWSAQAQPPQLQDALEVSEQHLDLLASMSDLFVGGRAGKGPGHVAGILVDVARDLAGWGVGTALGLEHTAITIALTGPVDAGTVLGDAGSRRGIGAMELDQQLALGTGVAILLGIEGEVGSGEGAVGAVGLVEHRDVRSNAALLDQEGEVLGRAIGAVGGKALRLEAEALGGPVEHGARGAHLRLPNGPARLDIEDDRMVGVDQIVGGIGEEGLALVGPGPLRRRIGW